MKLSILGAFLVTALAFVEAKHYDGGRIVHGQPAAREQFPHQVAVRIHRGGSYAGFCGGSIIANQWVMTAAHCADTNYEYQLFLGGLTLNATEDERLTVWANETYIHDDYNANVHNDIALIKLPSPVPFSDNIRPARFPSRGDVVPADVKLTVSGWGRTSDSSPGVSNLLNFVEITSISNEECIKTYGNGIVIPSILCVVGAPHHGTCNGDSGGPIVQYVNGEATQVAIVSWGHIDGCETTYPSGFTRVEAKLDWIAAVTGLNV